MQQFSLIDLFIGLFESAVYVSGDKLAHLQEYFWLYIQLLVQCADIAADRLRWNLSLVTGRQQYWCIVLYQSCIYSQKCSWRWASLSPETCRAD